MYCKLQGPLYPQLRLDVDGTTTGPVVVSLLLTLDLVDLRRAQQLVVLQQLVLLVFVHFLPVFCG